MRILISNDDGVNSAGIRALYNELKRIAEVVVVAPTEEKSTTGHSLTLHKPIRVTKIQDNFYGVSGSPADCVNFAIQEILGHKPDFVISGINKGGNLGQDVYYSGTVSAAREAAIQGIPSLAISLVIEFGKHVTDEDLDFETPAKVTKKVLHELRKADFPKHSLLNMNVPNKPLKKIKGIVLAQQGFRHYSGAILKRRDHRGRDYYWIGGKYLGFEKLEGTDCTLVDQGYVTITPMRLDLTDHQFLKGLKEFKLFQEG